MEPPAKSNGKKGRSKQNKQNAISSDGSPAVNSPLKQPVEQRAGIGRPTNDKNGSRTTEQVNSHKEVASPSNPASSQKNNQSGREPVAKRHQKDHNKEPQTSSGSSTSKVGKTNGKKAELTRSLAPHPIDSTETSGDAIQQTPDKTPAPSKREKSKKQQQKKGRKEPDAEQESAQQTTVPKKSPKKPKKMKSSETQQEEPLFADQVVLPKSKPSGAPQDFPGGSKETSALAATATSTNSKNLPVDKAENVLTAQDAKAPESAPSGKPETENLPTVSQTKGKKKNKKNKNSSLSKPEDSNQKEKEQQTKQEAADENPSLNEAGSTVSAETRSPQEISAGPSDKVGDSLATGLSPRLEPIADGSQLKLAAEDLFQATAMRVHAEDAAANIEQMLSLDEIVKIEESMRLALAKHLLPAACEIVASCQEVFARSKRSTSAKQKANKHVHFVDEPSNAVQMGERWGKLHITLSAAHALCLAKACASHGGLMESLIDSLKRISASDSQPVSQASTDFCWIHGRTVGSSDIEKIAQSAVSGKGQNLNLASTGIAPPLVCQLLSLLHGAPIKILDLSYARLGENECAVLGTVLPTLSNLTDLILEGCDLPPNAPALLDLAHCAATRVNLSNNAISDEGAARVSQSLEAPGCQIKYLNISNNGISSHGGKRLCKALARNSSLKSVYLDDNSIADSAEGLVQACGVVELSLKCTGIRPPTAKKLLSGLLLQKKTSIALIDLSGNELLENCVTPAMREQATIIV